MGTSEKVPIFAEIEREEGHTLPSSQSPHACRYLAARVCLQSEPRNPVRFRGFLPFYGLFLLSRAGARGAAMAFPPPARSR